MDSFSLLDIQVDSLTTHYYLSLGCQVDFARKEPVADEPAGAGCPGLPEPHGHEVTGGNRGTDGTFSDGRRTEAVLAGTKICSELWAGSRESPPQFYN